MKDLIIIARCQRIKRQNALEEIGEFHFKGVFYGEEIKKILLVIPQNQSIVVNEEYILHVQLKFVQDQFLFGKILKSKNLDLCYQQD